MSKLENFYPFVKQNEWIDIPKFFKYIEKQPKGFIFRTCNDVVKMFHDNWTSTWFKNTTQDFRKFYELFTSLKIRHDIPLVDKVARNNKFSGCSQHRFKAQAFEDIFTFPSRISTIVDESINTIPHIRQAAESLQTTAGNINEMLQQIQDFVKVCKDRLVQVYTNITTRGLDLALIILKLIAAAFLLQQETNQNLANVIAILTLIMPSSVVSYIQSFAVGLIRVIKGMSGLHAQAEDEDNRGFITAFFQLTVGIIKGLFSEVPKEVYESLHISNKKVKLIADYIRGVTTISEFILKMFARMMELIGDKIMKYYNILPSLIKEDVLTPLIEDFTEIKLNRLDESCTINKEDARRVITLYEKLLLFEAKMNKQNKNRYDIKVTPYVRIMIKSLEGAISRMPEHLRSGLVPRRIKPFWVYIYGDPRIGKSAVVQPYIVNVLAQSMGLIKKYEDYTNFTYLRNCGEDYWEGYNNHPVLWYNDLFQNYAQDEAMHKAVLELTNIVDDNVYPLNMAFERKHCVYFNSDLVISNAQNEILNAGFIANKCWSGGQHLYARRNICVHISVNDKYAKGPGTDREPGIDYAKMQAEMDRLPNKCVGYEHCVLHTQEEYSQKLLFPNDLYKMSFTDPVTGYVQMVTDFAAGMHYIAYEAQQYRTTQGDFKNRLYRHFEDSFNAGQYKVLQAGVRAQGEEDFCGPRLHSNDHSIDPDEGWCDAPGFEDCDRHRFVEFQLQSALREIEKSMPGLIGATDMQRIARTRTRQDNNALEVIYMWYAQGSTDSQDTFTRVSLAIEVIGDEYWSQQNLTWWQKFKLQLNNAWLSIRNFFRFSLDQLPLIRDLVYLCCVAYLFYLFGKIINGCLISWWTIFTRNKNCPACKPLLMSSSARREWLDGKPLATVAKAEMKDVNRGYGKQLEDEIQASCAAATWDVDCVAQTAEGKNKPAKPQIKRVQKTVGVKAQSYDPQNQIVEDIISKQMCKWKIKVMAEDEVKHERIFGSGLCLGSDIFVAPHHFWFRWFEMKEYWEKHGLTVHLCILWTEKLEQQLDWNSLERYALNYHHAEDLVYFRIKNLVQKAHIKKFFVSANDEPVLYEMYLFGRRALHYNFGMITANNGEYTMQSYDHESADDPLYGGKFQKRQVNIPMCVIYKSCITVTGDCGMVVMHCDSRLNCRKIMGMHTAGSISQQIGVGSLIYQEDIEEVFNYFYSKEKPIQMMAMEYKKPNPELAFKLEEMGFVVLGEVPRLLVPEYNVDRVPCLTLPRKSKISKSVVYDIMEQDFGPSKVAPARLRPYEVDGEVISPFYNAMNKLVKCSPMPDKQLAEHVSQHMFESIVTWGEVYKPRILTDLEMINGTGLLNPIEMSTSPGFPYITLDNKTGKHPFFIETNESPRQYVMGPYLTAQFEERENLAKLGIIKETYFVDTLKDETRPLEKVEKGKTRLFQVAPVDLNLLLRKYFGAFINHAQSAYITGEGAVGINANSMDWTLMAKYLLSIGDDIINGDCENYDASAGQAMAMFNVEAVNKWYQLGDDWKEEDDLVRKVLWTTFLNSKHIHRNILYILFQGNKSGTVVTTWFNILTGMFCIRYAYLTKKYDLRVFHLYIRPKFFGDDDLIMINSRMIDLTTKDYAQILYRKLGIKYTSATKGELIDGWYKIDQVSFLKRKFYLVNEKYIPQLDYAVIMEIPRWSESDPLNVVDQMNRFNSALLEMSNYGEQQFTMLRTKFVEYCYLMRNLGLNARPSELFNYSYCDYIKWGEDYSPIPGFDRIEGFGKPTVVQTQGCFDEVTLPTLTDNVSLHSVIVAQTSNSNTQAQTHEGKSKPSRPQVIRGERPKAQGEEDTDFNLYLTIMDYIKELEPCMTTFSRALNRIVKDEYVSTQFSMLHRKVKLLIKTYNSCRSLLQPDIEPVAKKRDFKDLISMEKLKAAMSQVTDFEAQGEEVALPNQIAPTAESIPVTGEAVKDEHIDKQSRAIFISDNTPHQPPVIHTTVPHPNNSNIKMDHSSFFETPMLISQFKWASTDTQWSSMGSLDFPNVWCSLDPINAKLSMMMYMRPDFEIEIFCNSSKFHYGRLVFVVAPFANGATAIPDAYLKPQNAFTWPHWYQISAGTNQSVKFIVPYRNVLSQILLTQATPHTRKMFSIYSWVSVPLSSANGTCAPVEVSIFARAVKTNFAGKAYNSVVAQGEEQREATKTTLTTLNPIGPTSGRVVSSGLAGVSRITHDMAHLTYSAGFSVPVNAASTGSMQLRQPILNRAEDCPNSVMLGPSAACRVVPSREYVNSEGDDMNINYICAHPALLYTYKLTNKDGVGAILWSQVLRPGLMKFGATGYTDPNNAIYPLPMGYVSRFFRLWRGGFKFHFSVVCSAFHSCRMRIFYTPGSIDDSIPSNPADVRQGSFLQNVVWDINTNSDISVEIPFEAPTHWRAMDASASNASGGTIGLQLINILTSADPSGEVSPIYIQVFASGADDMQFNYPINRSVTGDNASSGGFNKWAPDLKETVTFTAQGEEVKECAIPASSSTCIRQQKAILMGDVDAKHRKYHDNNAFVYTSLKQLCNQLTPIDKFSSTTTATEAKIQGRAYSPYGIGWDTRPWDDNWWNSPFHCIIPMFRFMRGGFRVYVMVNDKVQATAWVSVDNPVTSGSKATTTQVSSYEADNRCFMNGDSTEAAPLTCTTYGCAYFFDNSIYPIDVTTPYNSIWPCRLTLNGFYANESATRVHIGLSTQRTAKNMIFCVAGADDFMLGYRMSIPRVRFGAKTTTPALNLETPSIEIPKTYFASIGEHYYRLDPNLVWNPVMIEPDHVDYVYTTIENVGNVWTRPDKKYPSTIDGNILVSLIKLAPEKIETPKNTRARRSIIDKIMGGQYTDFSESD